MHKQVAPNSNFWVSQYDPGVKHRWLYIYAAMALDLIYYAHLFGQLLILAPSTPRLHLGGTVAGMPLNTVKLEIFRENFISANSLKRHLYQLTTE